MDFQNDAEFVGGCIAGGRRYLHINANGDGSMCIYPLFQCQHPRKYTPGSAEEPDVYGIS